MMNFAGPVGSAEDKQSSEAGSGELTFELDAGEHYSDLSIAGMFY